MRKKRTTLWEECKPKNPFPKFFSSTVIIAQSILFFFIWRRQNRLHGSVSFVQNSLSLCWTLSICQQTVCPRGTGWISLFTSFVLKILWMLFKHPLATLFVFRIPCSLINITYSLDEGEAYWILAGYVRHGKPVVRGKQRTEKLDLKIAERREKIEWRSAKCKYTSWGVSCLNHNNPLLYTCALKSGD